MTAVEHPHLTASEAELLGEATIDRLLAAARAGELDAGDLVNRFFLEARDHYLSYSGKWRRRIPLWLTSQGIPASRVVELERSWLAACRPSSDFDRQRSWRHFRQSCRRLEAQLRSMSLDDGETLGQVTCLRHDWQVLHDFCVNYIASGLSWVVEEFGEDALELVIRFVLGGYVRRPGPAFAVVRDVATSMRGHLAGPGRRGSLEVRQTPDGWMLRFDRCGSGGQLLAGYADRGDLSHLLRSPHDWAWGRTGVCHYCAHCCLGLTVMPIERDGVPVVLIDPPTFDLETGQMRKSHCDFHVFSAQAHDGPPAPPSAGDPACPTGHARLTEAVDADGR